MNPLSVSTFSAAIVATGFFASWIIYPSLQAEDTRLATYNTTTATKLLTLQDCSLIDPYSNPVSF